MNDEQQPGKTIRVEDDLEYSNALVRCRLDTGEEVYVSLKTLMAALLPELAEMMRLCPGARY